MFGAEASLQANEELLVLLGVRGVHGCHHVFKSALKSQQLFKGIAHQPGRRVVVSITDVDIMLDNFIFVLFCFAFQNATVHVSILRVEFGIRNCLEKKSSFIQDLPALLPPTGLEVMRQMTQQP